MSVAKDGEGAVHGEEPPPAYHQILDEKEAAAPEEKPLAEESASTTAGGETSPAGECTATKAELAGEVEEVSSTKSSLNDKKRKFGLHLMSGIILVSTKSST